jgi:hypothetical protein
MPFLSLLRQYGAREYGVTLAIAAIAGLAIAVLINSSSGGAGEPALLKTPQQEVAKTSPAPAAPKVHKAVRKERPVSHRAAQRHHRRHRTHRSRAVPAPVPQPKQESEASTPAPRTTPTTPTTKSVPVVRNPAPKPAPKSVPSRKPSGGGIQFDDSG